MAGRLPPTLTLDGDLDGLLRVSRQAEAYFHQVERQGGPEDHWEVERLLGGRPTSWLAVG